MIRLVFVAVVLLIVACVEGPQGPMGLQGERGDSASVYKKVSYFTITDIAGCRYNADTKYWEIQSYYCSTIKNIDSCIVQLFVRLDSNHYWKEPDWMYGYTYRDLWHIVLKDDGLKYSGYEGKLVVVGQ